MINEDKLRELGIRLDEVLAKLLGEYHEHKCVNCKGVKEGCINCRRTGYDQAPCKICDKDGVAFMNKSEAKASLQSIVNDMCAEALRDRIAAELEHLRESSLLHNLPEEYVKPLEYRLEQELRFLTSQTRRISNEHN